MIHSPAWIWVTLFLLGAYHGLNPGMGWLFAVGLGLQKQDARAVWRSLLPIGMGHLLAIALVVAVAVIAGAVIPLHVLKIAVVIILLAFGAYRISGRGHLRWGGMQVGFRDLTIWSFLMASAHGAGFMLLPILIGMSGMAAGHELHAMSLPGLAPQILAVAIHTIGYLLLTGTIAWVVYKKLGLSLLRRNWLNMDLVWAGALILTAGLTFFIT
jgi:hypothetical protein